LIPSEELEILIKSRQPIIWVVTWEEHRLDLALHEIAKHNYLEFSTWTFASGLSKLAGSDKPIMLNPIEILEIIDQHNVGTMFVLRDYHSFLKDAQVVRKLRDITESKSIYNPIIITSPVLNIPIELEKLVHVIDYTLPGVKDISMMVDEALDFIEDRDIDVDSVVKACQGLTADEIENVFAKSTVVSGTLDPDIISNEKKQIIRKSGILDLYDEADDFNDIGGMDNLKHWIMQRSKAFTEEAKSYGLQTPKGMLLLGIPGTGKSMICKAISNLWRMPLLRLDIGRMMAGIVGSSEENMRKAIRLAEACSPCILFIDEIEKGLSGMASSNFSDAGTTSRLVSTLLQWLSDKTSPVFVVATANSIEELSPELLRKGRFDEIFFLDLPNKLDREEITKIHLTKRGRNIEDFYVNVIASETVGFSGSEIEQVIMAAMFDVYSKTNGARDINTEDILNAVGSTKPLSVTMKEKVDKLRKWCLTRARLASTTVEDNSFLLKRKNKREK